MTRLSLTATIFSFAIMTDVDEMEGFSVRTKLQYGHARKKLQPLLSHFPFLFVSLLSLLHFPFAQQWALSTFFLSMLINGCTINKVKIKRHMEAAIFILQKY